MIPIPLYPNQLDDYFCFYRNFYNKFKILDGR